MGNLPGGRCDIVSLHIIVSTRLLCGLMRTEQRAPRQWLCYTEFILAARVLVHEHRLWNILHRGSHFRARGEFLISLPRVLR